MHLGSLGLLGIPCPLKRKEFGWSGYLEGRVLGGMSLALTKRSTRVMNKNEPPGPPELLEVFFIVNALVFTLAMIVQGVDIFSWIM
jgi:hypothetical protein